MTCECDKDKLPKHQCPYEVHVGLNTKPHCSCCEHCQEQCKTDASEDNHEKTF